MKYAFSRAVTCNMCGSKVDAHRILGRRLNVSQGLWPSKKIGLATTVVQCDVCHLIYPDPLPVPESLEDHYGVPPESYWEAAYLELNTQTSYFRGELETFDRLSQPAPIHTTRRALDVGAGIGKCIRALSQAGFEAHGLEPSEPFHRMALERTGIPPTRLHLARVEEAVLPESFFDLVVFGAVLEHFYDPDLALQSALRWVKPEGLIYVEVPSARWLLSRMARTFYRLQGTDYVINLSPMHRPYHLYEFTPEAFEANGRRRGFEVVHHEHFVCQTYTPKILDAPLRRFMKATNTGMDLSIWLRKKP